MRKGLLVMFEDEVEVDPKYPILINKYLLDVIDFDVYVIDWHRNIEG